jgi:hypothetical protein
VNNSFIGNTLNVHFFSNFINYWNNATCGNYWDDYEEQNLDADFIGGYWTTPYKLDIANEDQHPIMKNHSPRINQSYPLQYIYGYRNYSVSWSIRDISSLNGNYSLWVDDILNQSVTPYYKTCTPVINIPDLSLGVHNFTIILNDGLGIITKNTILVNVILNQLPIINGNDSITIIEHWPIPHILSWHIQDTTINNPIFLLSLNGSFVKDGCWSHNHIINYTLPELDPAEYNVSMLLIDGYGDPVQYDTKVLVLRNESPILPSINSVLLSENSTSYPLSMKISDDTVFQGQYFIYRNSSLILNGSWISDSTFLLTFGNLSLGNWNYTIIATDGLGGNSSISFSIIISSIINISIKDNSEGNSTESNSSTTNPFSIDLPENIPGYNLYFMGFILILSIGWISKKIKIKKFLHR